MNTFGGLLALAIADTMSRFVFILLALREYLKVSSNLRTKTRIIITYEVTLKFVRNNDFVLCECEEH